ncbi:hypothetical protein [Halovivax limisalsi]|uniref:hypothetical protein n=1 Tax=Halovivax limisalsi TaxID=1453760 RepID=UPI001FFD66D7|nr:hypothetical protein [Halovivax limisalsi]
MDTASATEEPASDRLAAALDRGAGDGTLAVVAGGTALFVAGRIASDGALRSALAAVAGAGLLGYGVEKRVALAGRGSGIGDEPAAEESDWHPSRDDAPAERPRTGSEPSIEDATDTRPSSDDAVEADPRRSADESGTSIDIAPPGSAADESDAGTDRDRTQAESTRTDPVDDSDGDVGDRDAEPGTSGDRDGTEPDDTDSATGGE